MNEFELFPITFSIIAFTVVISLIAFTKQEVKYKLLFYPYVMNRPDEYHRFVSYGFIHADFIHLFFNMFTLYSFGRIVEATLFNRTQYLLFYISALVASNIFDFIKHRNDSRYSALGASGAVSGVVFATIIFDPWEKSVMLFGVLALPNIVFAALYIYYCIYMAKRGTDNIGHNAHLWGSLYGFVFTAVLHPDLAINFFTLLTHPTF